MNRTIGFINRISEPKLLLILAAMSCLSSLLLTWWIAYPRGSGTDGAFYALSGANLFLGNGFTYSNVPNTFTWPLFSILIGLINLMVDNLQVSSHVILILSYTVSVFPFYYAAKNLFDEETAIISAILFSFNGFLIRMSGRLLPETVLILCLLCSVFFVSRIIKEHRESARSSVHNWVLAGLFFGLSYLTKPESLQYFVITWLFLLLLVVRRNTSCFLKIALMTLAFSAVILPQIVFIHEHTGKWELTTYNRFLFRGYVEPLISLSPGEPATDPHVEQNYNAYIVRGEYTTKELEKDISGLSSHSINYLKSFFTVIGPVHLFLFAVSWFVFLPALTISRRYLYVLLVPLATLFLWFKPVDRHFVVFVPFLLLLSASTITAWIERAPGNKNWIISIASVLIFIQSYTPMLNQAPTNSVIDNHKKMGEWIKTNIPNIKGKLIADRKPYIVFMVQARYFRYNNIQDYKTLIRILKKNHVEYLVVDDFYTKTQNPGIMELLDGRDRPELEFLHSEDDPIWGKALLYRIKEDNL